MLRELGAHPESTAPVRLLEGRYGPYVTDGTTNASLPKEMKADEVTLEAAVDLLKARESASGGSNGRSRGRRGGGRRGTTRKPAARRPRG